MRSALNICAVAGAGVVGAGLVVTTPVVARPSDIRTVEIQLTADDQNIYIDFVRHGETLGKDNIVSTTGLPGAELDDAGEKQAQSVAETLSGRLGTPDDGGGVAAIYAGQNIRMPETVAPFAALEHMDTHISSGLNEIGGGIYGGGLLSGPAGILYELTEAAWAFGVLSVPILGSNDPNGIVFEDGVNTVMQQMYTEALANGTTSLDGHVTVVAASGEAAISAMTLLNVDNPDIGIFLPRLIESLTSGDSHPFLANGGVVEIEGNPTDGWTLISWDGQDIPKDPGLLSDLVVDLRNVITPPQIGAYNLIEALVTGDPTTIAHAAGTGLTNFGSALLQFPGSVADDIVTEVKNLGDALAGGESFSDAFDSAILGIVS